MNGKFKKEIEEIKTPSENDVFKNIVSTDRQENPIPQSTTKHDVEGNALRSTEEKSQASENNANTGVEVEIKEGPKIKGRGRHKLDCDCEKCKAKNNKDGKAPESKGTESKGPDDKTALDDDLSKYKKVATPEGTITPSTPEETKIDVGKYISGALFLIAVDSVFPSLVLKIAMFISPKYKGIKVKQLKLTAEERTELEPLADEVVKIIFGQLNPITAFALCYGILLFGKIVLLSPDE